MNLEQALTILDGKDLADTLGHWNQDRHAWPVADNDRRRLLERALLDRDQVAEQMKMLPSRLRDLLVFVIRSGVWGKPFDLKNFGDDEIPVASHEAIPVGAALHDRGFFCATRIPGGPQRPSVFIVPSEIGQVLEGILDASLRPVDAALSFHSYLRFLDRKDLGDRLEKLGIDAAPEDIGQGLRAQLSAPEAILERINLIEDDDLRELVLAVEEHGGVMDGLCRRRLGIEADEEQLVAWGQELESLLLGCFESVDLTNHGLNCRSGWLVLFREHVDAMWAINDLDQDEASSDLQRGADPLADIRALVEETTRQPVKLKKTGEYHKTGLRKIAKSVLTPGARPTGAEADLEFLLDFLRRREFLKLNLDNCLQVTPSWRPWMARDARKRAKDLLEFGLKNQRRGFSFLHHRVLRNALLDGFRELGSPNWMSVRRLVLQARNKSLLEAVRPEQVSLYQDTHKNAPFPKLVAPDEMQQALSTWLLEGLNRVGAIELAFQSDGKRPYAARLTAMGALILGVKVEQKTSGEGRGLIVNADHEIVVFPEHAAAELIQNLGRFAVREKAEFALHYRLSKQSVQAGIADGLNEDQIVSLLAENARHGVPENVVFSIREWANKVVRLECRRSYLLQSSDKEAMDHFLSVPEIEPIIVGRLSETSVELSEDPRLSSVISLLRERGIYL